MAQKTKKELENLLEIERNRKSELITENGRLSEALQRERGARDGVIEREQGLINRIERLHEKTTGMLLEIIRWQISPNTAADPWNRIRVETLKAENDKVGRSFNDNFYGEGKNA